MTDLHRSNRRLLFGLIIGTMLGTLAYSACDAYRQHARAQRAIDAVHGIPPEHPIIRGPAPIERDGVILIPVDNAPPLP